MSQAIAEMHEFKSPPHEIDGNVITEPGRVHIMTGDPSTLQLMCAVEQSGALDFWENPDEDIYSQSDGDPI